MITSFDRDFENLLPETYALLQRSNVVIHESVKEISLSGSRGLRSSARADSDVDLSLIVDVKQLPTRDPERGQFLRNVLETTISHWQGPVEVDLAAVFDKLDCCGLKCFQTRLYDPAIIRDRGTDCFGIYKIQRGFDGYVTQGVELARIYPLLSIWHGAELRKTR